MLKVKKRHKAEKVTELLPRGVADEITRLALGRRCGLGGLREVRIRRSGACSAVLGKEALRLCSHIDRAEMDALVERLLGGALYAHRDSIASGYVSIGEGIRVGVCGRAAYEGERLVGVSDMHSLLFRIPTGECAFENELRQLAAAPFGSGMLIYSPPGVGKTTALRTLAAILGGGEAPRRICVVDERFEFSEEDYRGLEVDILSGYKRRVGVEIATRTMSPDIIIIDEIGADEGEALSAALKCGIPIIASAHAGSLDELLSKPSLKALFDIGVFSLTVGISCTAGQYTLSADRL